MFLYADNGINWTAGDSDGGIGGLASPTGLAAGVGFDAGDGQHYKFLDESFNNTNEIVNVEEKSNVNIPGLFVFQVDGLEILGKIINYNRPCMNKNDYV